MSQKVSLLLSSVCFFCFLFLFSFTSFGQDVKGKVTDALTGESMVDATVTLKSNTNTFTTRTGLDGSFHFKKITEGIYTQTMQVQAVSSQRIQTCIGGNMCKINVIQLWMVSN